MSDGQSRTQQGLVYELGTIFDQIARLAPEAQPEAIRLLTQMRCAETPSIVSKSFDRAVGKRHIVYVHGICKHSAGFSDQWWDALHPFTDVFGDGSRGSGGSRHEVLWSDLVSDRGVRGIPDQDKLSQQEWAARVRGVLEDRAANQALSPNERGMRQVVLGRDLHPRERIGRGVSFARELSIPTLNCVDDFSVYMFNEAVRSQIIAKFTDTVRPLLADGSHVDIISHSWGTVVAYEGLRLLEDQGASTASVSTFFTVGAALSIFLVKTRLRPANTDGRKPAPVGKWINLNAHGDPVGGNLKENPYAVDDEFLGLDNLGCGLLDVSCAHGSYFKPDNDAVNRDIFAAFINASDNS